MEVAACRVCRQHLTSGGNCSVCVELLRNVVFLDAEDAQDAVDLSEVSSEMLAGLKESMRATRAVIRASGGKDPVATRQLIQLSKALAAMVDTTRKVRKEGSEGIKGLPFADKLDIFANWFLDLGAQHRAAVLKNLQSANDALLLSAPSAPRLESGVSHEAD